MGNPCRYALAAGLEIVLRCDRDRVLCDQRFIGGGSTDGCFEGEKTMKFRKLMLAILGLAVVVGMTVPANAMAHKHHKKHHHHHA